jgi:hypothetical protein
MRLKTQRPQRPDDIYSGATVKPARKEKALSFDTDCLSYWLTIVLADPSQTAGVTSLAHQGLYKPRLRDILGSQKPALKAP